MLDQFYIVSGLCPNLSKCEIAGTSLWKDAKVGFCGSKSLNLTKDSIKILGAYISYPKKLQDDIHFCMVVKKYLCDKIITHDTFTSRG